MKSVSRWFLSVTLVCSSLSFSLSSCTIESPTIAPTQTPQPTTTVERTPTTTKTSPPTSPPGTTQPGSSVRNPTPIVDMGPSPSPTPTLTSTVTPTPTPASLSQEGPWLVFQAGDNLWVVNADGTGGWLLAHDLPVINMVAAPHGGHLAMLAMPNRQLYEDAELMILSLPEGTIQTITRLMAEDFEAMVKASMSFEEPYELYQYTIEVMSASVIANRLAWSMDGRHLVFAAALDGPSADLYRYSPSSGEITRLTDGPTQAVDPVWSPDNKFVVHGAASRLNLEASGLGYSMQGVWATRTDGLGSHLIYPTELYGFENVIAWLSPTTFLADEYVWMCEYTQLQKVSLGGNIQELWTGNYNLRAFDSQSRTMLISVPSYLAESPCHIDHEPGLYLLSIRDQTSMRVPVSNDLANSCRYLSWSPEAGLFYCGSSTELIAIQPDGEVISFEAPTNTHILPTVAPNGKQWVWASAERRGHLYLGAPEEPAQMIYYGNAFDPLWTPDSRGVFFFNGTGCDDVRLHLAQGPEFEPQHVKLEIASEKCPSPMIWVLP